MKAREAPGTAPPITGFAPAADEQALFRRLFDLSPVPAWILDGNRIVECNEAAFLTLGHPSREVLLNLRPSEISPPVQADGEDSPAKAQRMMELALQQGRHQFEWVLTKADGEGLVTEVTLSSTTHAGQPLLFCVWRDITQQRKAEKDLQDSEQLYRDVADNGQALIWLAGTDKACYYFNQPWLRFTGRTLAQEYGYGWAAGVHPDDFEHCLATFTGAFDRREKFSMMYRIRRHDGVYRWILDDGAPRYDSQNGFIGYVGHCLDITEQKAIEEQVRTLAFHDPLTNLLNRRFLIERLNQTMASSKRTGRHAALIFLDLDNFKPLNDRFGHEVGDALLRESAARLSACVREVDAVARFGGDEFVVILGDLHKERRESVSQAATIAEKIRVSISAPYCLPVHASASAGTCVDYRVSASIGVVVFVGNEHSHDQLLQCGDSAMYKAKEEGRNAIRFHGD